MKNCKIAAGFLFAAVIGASAVTSGCSKGPGKEELRLSGIEALNQGNYENALTYFDQALEKAKGKAGELEIDVLKYRAEAELGLEDYSAAAHTYDILYQVDQEKPEYLYMESIAKAMDGETEEALKLYQNAWETDKGLDRQVTGQKEALTAVGAACEADGKGEEAMVLYEEALSNGLQSSSLYNKMAVCSIMEGRYEEALSYIEKGFQTGDETAFGDLLYNQAVAYEYIGDFSKAKELLEEYAGRYGTDDNVEKELAFLRTR